MNNDNMKKKAFDNVLQVFHATTELEILETDLTVEVSKLIRKTLENSSLDFIDGDTLDILIDTNIDIESIVSKALILNKERD
tara:strand:- start:17566 stop:17811 length:246 start_codon:yes stop_codon:yes gene_type:complete